MGTYPHKASKREHDHCPSRTVGAVAKSKSGAHSLGHGLSTRIVLCSRSCHGRLIANFHHQHARVDEDQSNFYQRHEQPVLGPEACGCACWVREQALRVGGTLFDAPPKWPDGEMQQQEQNADEERHKHASLLKVFRDQQHPAHESQLATHLKRLPPRISARPQQHSIQHGNTCARVMSGMSGGVAHRGQGGIETTHRQAR
eukprot:2823063-Prymnesium_polylepis.2